MQLTIVLEEVLSCVRVGPVIQEIHEDASALTGAGEEGVGRMAGGGDPGARSFELRGEGATESGEAGF